MNSFLAIDNGSASVDSSQRLLVSTDLDATLLTETYDWSAAIPALKALATCEACLVLNSSKTFAEILQLAQAIRSECGLAPSPIVAENGTVIALPDASAPDGYRSECLGLDRGTILARARDLREQRGYDFTGFSDMSVPDLVALTGLGESAAKNALNRQATEPILWHSSEDEWLEFSGALATAGIRAVRGGQFIHLMGPSDKADGQRAAKVYCESMAPTESWLVVALGDSPNDLGMLNAADIAVVIQNPTHTIRLEPTAPRCVYPDHYGPVAWNEAMFEILNGIN